MTAGRDRAPARTSSARGARDQQRTRLPHEPHAERAAFHHQSRARVQLARPVADEIAEQAERGPLGASRPRARFGLTTFAPRLA